MTTSILLAGIENGNFDTTLISLYGADMLDLQRARYAKAVKEFIEKGDARFFNFEGEKAFKQCRKSAD